MSKPQNSAIRRNRAPRTEYNENGLKLTQVASSALHSVAYDAEKKSLHVRFAAGGNTYEYPDVTQEQHDALMAAESMGKHFRLHIMGRDFHRHEA